MWCGKFEDGTCLGGLWILDVLRFINYNTVPLQTTQELFIQPRQCKGGQDHIVLLTHFLETFFFFQPCIALMYYHA